MFHKHARTFVFCAMLLHGCGESFTTNSNQTTEVTTASTGGTTSSSSASTSAASTSSSTTGGSGGAHSTSETVAVGSSGTNGSGGGYVFSATCAGTVECPGEGPCADWNYEVTDSGTVTHVIGEVTPKSGMTCSGQVTYPSSDDVGMQVTGVIAFSCEGETWSFGMDRATSLVYVKTALTNFSWTPSCQ